MQSKLESLVGLVVTQVLRVHDYVQVLFEQDIVLNIYNEFKLSNGHNISALTDTKLLRAEEKGEAVIFYFSKGKHLATYLREGAYNGAETLELHVPGQPTGGWD